MKIVNRGYIVVHPKQHYIDWANQFEDEFLMDEFSEPTVYLIEDDFFEDDQVLKANFKKIFNNELIAVTEDESTYPEITLENFDAWFSYVLGTTVFDTQKSDLRAEK